MADHNGMPIKRLDTLLTETKWTSLMMPNPNRRWWQFWKPRSIVNSDALLPIFTQANEVLDGMVWVRGTPDG